MAKRALFTGSDLNPSSSVFEQISRKSVEEIQFLGRETIRRMIQEWRREARIVSERIRELKTISSGSATWHNEKFEDLIRKKQRIDARIKFLLALELGTESKPVISSARSGDWLNVGDPAVCYIRAGVTFKPFREGFMRGTVAEANGTFIVVLFSDRLHEGKLFDGHGVTLRYVSPQILRTREYRYLRAHLDFAKVWLEMILASEPHQPSLFTPEQYISDLTKVRVSF